MKQKIASIIIRSSSLRPEMRCVRNYDYGHIIEMILLKKQFCLISSGIYRIDEKNIMLGQ